MYLISGKGIPKDWKDKCSFARNVSENLITDTATAIHHYETVHGGRRLTAHSLFGKDPLEGNDNKMAAKEQTFFRYFTAKGIFEIPSQQSIVYFIELT